MPHHHAVRSRPDQLAFRSHDEARGLWLAILKRVSDPLALCLMPDHVHLLHILDVSKELGLALRGYARWRNRRNETRGPLWTRPSPPEAVHGAIKLRRSVRYIHLNPCRARLVTDPLAWPWSTHRDRVGLAVPQFRPTVPDPHAFHHYVSADPTVAVQGTLLPVGADRSPADAVFAAVSAVTRSPWGRLSGKGPARRLLVVCLRLFTDLTIAAIAGETGLNRRTVQRIPPQWTPAVRVVSQVLGDPRFSGLATGDLTLVPAWHRYRGRR
jgi:putative transposase